jgi:hypothetical protein
MALSSKANEGSYVQAISNRWDNALVGNFAAHTPSATDFTYPVTIYLTAAANVTFIPWEGSSSLTVGFPAGWVPIRMKRISAISAGSVYVGW